MKRKEAIKEKTENEVEVRTVNKLKNGGIKNNTQCGEWNNLKDGKIILGK